MDYTRRSELVKSCEKGFYTGIGKRVRLTGFYASGMFEIVVVVSEDNGRPHWAGSRGRRGLKKLTTESNRGQLCDVIWPL
jgi:hypothetical protein